MLYSVRPIRIRPPLRRRQRPRPLPEAACRDQRTGDRRWICRAVADDDTPLPPPDPPMIRSPEALPAASSMDTLPHVSLGTVDFNPPELPNVDHETLPAPTPIQTAPAAVAADACGRRCNIRGAAHTEDTGDGESRRRGNGLAEPQPAHTHGHFRAQGPSARRSLRGPAIRLATSTLATMSWQARVTLGYWWTEDDPWVPGGKLPTCGIETRFMSVGTTFGRLRR